MTQRSKVIESIKRNPGDVRFDDACKVAGWIGFERKGGSGSHVTFARPGERTMLNFQSRNGRVSVYQVRQLLVMIEKYEDDL
jgi:hypothetical protein